MSKYPCGLIEDLIPLYIEGDISDETRKIVEEHIGECRSCSSLVSEFSKGELKLDEFKEDLPQARTFKNWMKRLKIWGSITVILLIFAAAAIGTLGYKIGESRRFEHENIRKADSTYFMQLYTTNPLPDKTKITLYRAKDGVGVGFEDLSSRKFKLVDKLIYSSNPKWKYVELKGDDGSIYPFIYGYFVDLKNDPPSIMVANTSDNIKTQASVNTEMREHVWFLFLDKPVTDKNAFEIYIMQTPVDEYKPLY